MCSTAPAGARGMGACCPLDLYLLCAHHQRGPVQGPHPACRRKRCVMMLSTAVVQAGAVMRTQHHRLEGKASRGQGPACRGSHTLCLHGVSCFRWNNGAKSSATEGQCWLNAWQETGAI
jgi:hypothetical protein